MTIKDLLGSCCNRDVAVYIEPENCRIYDNNRQCFKDPGDALANYTYLNRLVQKFKFEMNVVGLVIKPALCITYDSEVHRSDSE